MVTTIIFMVDPKNKNFSCLFHSELNKIISEENILNFYSTLFSISTPPPPTLRKKRGNDKTKQK